MSMLLTELNRAKPTKFVDAHEGSSVTIERPGERPWKGTVTRNIAEFGPEGLPALFVLKEGSDEAELVVGNGKTRLVIDRVVERAVEPIPPADAYTIIPKATPSTAVQFTGGVHTASAIIRWAAGWSAIAYIEGPDEHMLIPAGGGDPATKVYPGDFVVCTPDHTFVRIEQNRVAEMYDVRPAGSRI